MVQALCQILANLGSGPVFVDHRELPQGQSLRTGLETQIDLVNTQIHIHPATSLADEP